MEAADRGDLGVGFSDGPAEVGPAGDHAGVVGRGGGVERQNAIGEGTGENLGECPLEIAAPPPRRHQGDAGQKLGFADGRGVKRHGVGTLGPAGDIGIGLGPQQFRDDVKLYPKLYTISASIRNRAVVTKDARTGGRQCPKWGRQTLKRRNTRCLRRIEMFL